MFCGQGDLRIEKQEAREKDIFGMVRATLIPNRDMLVVAGVGVANYYSTIPLDTSLSLAFIIDSNEFFKKDLL